MNKKLNHKLNKTNFKLNNYRVLKCDIIKKFKMGNCGICQDILKKRLLLDPTDLSPFRQLMKFTQCSFPIYKLGLSTTFYRIWVNTAFTD